MKLFEGKTPTERNKIIAAIVLGVVSLFALYMAFGRGLFSTKATITATVSPTPKTDSSPKSDQSNFRIPTQDEVTFGYETTPIVYNQTQFYAPDPGRNIFAFYEPPPPCKGAECPTPVIKTPEPPTPTPTPPFMIALTPQSVYAGSNGFRMDVTVLSGEKLTPETRIYFNMNEMPTRFVSPQQLSTEIPANFISAEGQRSIMVQTADGKLYSNQVALNVQAPPRPQFEYLGMIGRKRHNNDTAVFREGANKPEFSARLNDVLGGRFRLVSISANETIFQDVSLGFRHRVPLTQTPGAPTGTVPGGRNPGIPPGFEAYPQPMPMMPNYNVPPGDIPGIPSNIPRYVPPNANRQPSEKDVDDNDDP